MAPGIGPRQIPSGRVAEIRAPEAAGQRLPESVISSVWTNPLGRKVFLEVHVLVKAEEESHRELIGRTRCRDRPAPVPTAPPRVPSRIEEI